MLISLSPEIFNFIGQFFGIIAFLIAISKYFQKKKTTIMFLSIFSCIFYVIHYFLIGAIAGSYTIAIAGFRDFYIFLREKHHKKHRHRKIYNNVFVFLAFVAIYVILIFANLKTPVSILPLSAGLVYIGFEWFTTNKTTLKFASGLTTVPWVFYDIISFSIPALCSDIINLIACAIGITKDRKMRYNHRRNAKKGK